ncbi:hypothetical protein [Sphaerisporangium rubeum]|uniref:DUF4258 domain-containing protein n=1 Tax=Sphaerisporangium rubeum TaxID=321317 RepID=A0A7X0ID08_9ACTN|nr:hypothetical protein [Sphaerisporangium rubeum]MBB6472733.1 hypothetical protein [Sphaerisporangium rubeum]
MRKLRFYRSARKHRIGRAHALHVVRSGPPVIVPAGDPGLEDRWVWIGEDDRGIELEVIGILTEKSLVILHVMPTAFRRTKP